MDYAGALDPSLLTHSESPAPLPTALSTIVEREDSPGADTQDGEDAQEPRRRPAKRKHSPSAPTPPSRSPAPQLADPSDVSNPPVFIPHTLSIPETEFEFFATRSHPFNKHGFRYTPCGPSEGTPLPVPPQRTIESYPQGIRWSWEDRSPFTLMTEDARTITTDKGWRAVRSNIGVREGAWYWEVKVERAGGEGGRDQGGDGQGSWVRVGVGRRESPLNAPVGIDGHSYGYRDKTGDVVTLAQLKPYGTPYSTSSTIGIYISLPSRTPPAKSDRRDPARIQRKRIPIRYKGQLYFEQLEYAPSKEMDELLVDPALKAFRERQAEEKKAKAKAAAPGTKAPPPSQQGPPLRPLPKLEGSRVAFFVDGVCQGVAYEDLYDFLPLRKERTDEKKKKDARGVMENWHDDGALGYFAMASVFGGGIATINAGPDFDYPPPEDIDAVLEASPHPPRAGNPAKEHLPKEQTRWRPLSERYEEFVAEQARLDDLDEQEAIRVLLEAQRLAAEQQEAAGGLPAGGLAEKDAPSKKAKTAAATSLAAAAIAASSKLASLGVVKAEAAHSLSQSPAGSPMPFSGGGGGEVKMETDSGAE
ncbi:hypothetical protein JCM6882_004260 [Rhodosporidiobolus microsporus]